MGAHTTICLADWDGTLRRGYTIQDWLRFLVREGIVSREAFSMLRDSFALYRNGQITYRSIVSRAARAYALAVSGQSVHTLVSLAREFVTNDTQSLYKFTFPLLALLAEHRYETVVISGAPLELLKAYAEIMPIGRIFATECEKDQDGRIYPNVMSNHGLVDAKRNTVNYLIECGNCVWMALGNSMADQPLFDVAKHAIWVSKEPKVNYRHIEHLRPQTVLRRVRELLL